MLSPEAQLQGMAHPARGFDQRSRHGLDRGGGDPWGQAMCRPSRDVTNPTQRRRARGHPSLQACRRHGGPTRRAPRPIHGARQPLPIRPVRDQTRRRSDPYDPKPGNVVVVAVLGCHRQVVGDRRRRDPRVVDRHFLASVSKGKAQSCPGMSYCFVDR